MFCSNCGVAISDNDRFCSQCGSPLENPIRKKANITEYDKTFRVPGVMIFHPDEAVDEINAFFNSHLGLTYVRLHLQIERGFTKKITISCKESDDNMSFRFGMDVIIVLPRKVSLANLPKWYSNKPADTFINEWRGKNSEKQVITERIVTFENRTSEIFILYKYNINK